MLSLVIPTHNRRDTLIRCLEALAGQTVRDGWELVLVDDGSSDGSADMVEGRARDFPVPLRVLRQPAAGPGAARNRGIDAATGDLILFLDDDILAAPDLIAAHLEAHRLAPAREAAVLGYVTWSPALRPTPFMRWLGEKWWFCYGRFAPGAALDGSAFYTCNVSLKRSLLLAAGGFDERFPSAAFEDTDLGWRLERAGMRLVYHPEAWAWHHQFIRFADACRREQRVEAARPFLLRTEAGQAIAAQRAAGRPIPPWRRRAAALSTRLLRPLAPLLDTRIPLPSSFYRTILLAGARQQERQGSS